MHVDSPAVARSAFVQRGPDTFGQPAQTTRPVFTSPSYKDVAAPWPENSCNFAASGGSCPSATKLAIQRRFVHCQVKRAIREIHLACIHLDIFHPWTSSLSFAQLDRRGRIIDTHQSTCYASFSLQIHQQARNSATDIQYCRRLLARQQLHELPTFKQPLVSFRVVNATQYFAIPLLPKCLSSIAWQRCCSRSSHR